MNKRKKQKPRPSAKGKVAWYSCTRCKSQFSRSEYDLPVCVYTAWCSSIVFFCFYLYILIILLNSTTQLYTVSFFLKHVKIASSFFLLLNFLEIKKKNTNKQYTRNSKFFPTNMIFPNSSKPQSRAHHSSSKHAFCKQQDHNMPSRWYTVLALPFPDQRLGRRDINSFGRAGFYPSRAGYFSNPSLWIEKVNDKKMCHNNCTLDTPMNNTNKM